jgi:polar amino acid transport system permease protein
MQIVREALPLLLKGTQTTMLLVSVCLGFGLLLGVFLALVHVYGPRWAKPFLIVFDRIFRGFPALVLLFLFYFGIGGFPGVHLTPLTTVFLALGLRSAAYQTQIYRGGLLAVSKGQLDAARSLGMTKYQAIWSIAIPQAAYFSLPGLANEYSVLLKDTALAFAVGVMELLTASKFVALRTQAILPIYLAAGAIYLVLTYGGVLVFWLAEHLIRIPGLSGQGRPRMQ